MATPDEYEALYREGKEIEAREEGESRLPDMAGSTDFYELLGRALMEARREQGKVEILFDHPNRVFIKVYGLPSFGAGSQQHYGFPLRRELTHYL